MKSNKINEVVHEVTFHSRGFEAMKKRHLNRYSTKKDFPWNFFPPKYPFIKTDIEIIILLL